MILLTRQRKMSQLAGITLLCLCVVARVVSTSGADFEAVKSIFPRQSADCDEITSQLTGIFTPCTVSLRQCLRMTAPATLATLLCNPSLSGSGFNAFRELVLCRGREFGDDVWATTCSVVNGSKCYELMERHQDLVDNTSRECCGALTCSNECQTNLQSVVDKLQCCVHTLPLKLLFQGCKLNDTSNFGGSGSGNGEVMVPDSELEIAFSACDVEFPDHCEHLFSNINITADADNGGSERISSSVVSVVFLLLMLIFTAVSC